MCGVDCVCIYICVCVCIYIYIYIYIYGCVLCIYELYIHRSVHRESNLITVQQDATYSVYYISVGSSVAIGGENLLQFFLAASIRNGFFIFASMSLTACSVSIIKLVQYFHRGVNTGPTHGSKDAESIPDTRCQKTATNFHLR